MATFDLDSISSLALRIAKGELSFITVCNLADEVTIDGEQITQRDYIRQAFFDVGIEIEFSGKNQYEKGVVIDMDEDKMTALSLSPNALRFGQTVVKVIAR